MDFRKKYEKQSGEIAVKAKLNEEPCTFTYGYTVWLESQLNRVENIVKRSICLPKGVEPEDWSDYKRESK